MTMEGKLVVYYFRLAERDEGSGHRVRMPLLPLPEEEDLGALEGNGVGDVFHDQDDPVPVQVPRCLQWLPGAHLFGRQAGEVDREHRKSASTDRIH